MTIRIRDIVTFTQRRIVPLRVRRNASQTAKVDGSLVHANKPA